MNKKRISLLLALLMVIFVFPTSIRAASDYYSHLRRDVTFFAKDSRTGVSLDGVNFRIYNGESYREDLGSTTSSTRLEPGRYTITATKDGYHVGTRVIDVACTPDRQSFDFSLNRDSSKPLPKDNTLYLRTLDASTGYEISNVRYFIEDLNNSNKNQTIYANSITLSDGNYRISAIREGYGTQSKTVYMTGKRQDLTFSLARGSYYPIGRDIIIKNVSVYSNRVIGDTAPYAKVNLYIHGSFVKSVNADSAGYFEILNTFANYYGDYRDYGRDYFYGDLRNYYLVAEKDGYTSSRFYLNDSRYKDDFYRPPAPSRETATAPVILEALGGESFVRGEKATPFANITIKDASGEVLGTTALDFEAKFAIRTKRPLIAGELITITTSHERYVDKISSVVVGATQVPEKTVEAFDYINKFTIGSKTFTRIIDTKVSTEYMDVDPYITNGRTMLPIRFVAQALGYEVTFDDTTKNALFAKGDTSLVMNLKSRDFYVNGKKHTLSVDPVTVNGRIMLPISELGTALGLSHGNIGEGKNIEWDGTNRVVIVQIKK